MKKIYLFLVIALLAGCNMQSRKDRFGKDDTMSYPCAEWDRAGVILMHTPGHELFDGVIHPSAGLFENYFDLEKAAEEHRGYIRKLEANGIRVHTVTDILNEVGLDTLRALVDKELRYDISALLDADPDATEAYRQEVLALMSRGDLMRCLFFKPLVRLLPTDNNTGVVAEYLHAPLMNLYFTRDQSITTPCGHIICCMNSAQRALETDIIELCYRHLGAAPILRIEGKGRLEGGDYIPAGTIALIGCGMRTNEEGIRQIMEADAFGHDTIVVVHDHKRWQMQMHLDTHFNIIDRNLCTMVSSRLYAKPGEPEFNTCDIYVRAPGSKPYSLQQKDVPFVEYIRGRGMEIIPIDYNDEMHYANNYLTIAPRHIMAVAGQSEAFQQHLAAAGVKVEWIPLESLIDGYGAAHCMTQVMKRASKQNQTNIKKSK